ncbi:MAG: hypothetical protein QNL12_15655, partial [Acidimicrobiia bacterium]|nr:hypothetical protein [Acidimicrobiia bacterium]MDX2468749.1 hypothetical protein [Acidimicrobiia bacterium]
WLSPRVVLYDWTLLLLPGIILVTRRAELKDAWLGLGGLLAVAAAFSLQFTETQLDSGTRAVQLAVPVLALVAVLATRSLTAKPAD